MKELKDSVLSILALRNSYYAPFDVGVPHGATKIINGHV